MRVLKFFKYHLLINQRITKASVPLTDYKGVRGFAVDGSIG